MNKLILTTATALSLFLVGCSDDQAAEAIPPASEAPAEPSKTQQALDRLKEAADLAGDAAREEAVKLRKQAQDALENSGPLLDQARDMANQLRGRLDTYADQAAKDLGAAGQDLERRIREATGTPVPPTSQPEAVLSPRDKLNADTRAAATPRPGGAAPDYVGVWAQSPAACAKIDQPDATNFAVITPTTIRREASVCNMADPSLVDGRATVQASCFADGKEIEEEIRLALPSPETLRIATAASSDSAALTRCHLPD
ncbi:hypothetical protein ACFOEZ_05315 [Tianweitania populi]|uniref:DUF4398 domain-containing protein n=1 Tax=Tianweitania populi TaxID=1607949 RepID=A0A8J3DN73_9HYPH|nr:hypothetical protein [Tianweitania populi]GHD08872.1 hypothetical protein GCM10016234_08900 [Tianweitania populi]